MKTQSVHNNEIHQQKCGPLKVINYHNARKVDIQFINTGTKLTVHAAQIIKGTIEDKLHPRILGVGYHGYGTHLCSIKGKLTKPYTLWYDMLSRCYNKELHQTKHATYTHSEVCKEWCNFQVFAEWLKHNYVKDWHLDKDIKSINSNTYSPSTCLYIPREVNMTEAILRKLVNLDNSYDSIYQNFKKLTIKKYDRKI